MQLFGVFFDVLKFQPIRPLIALLTQNFPYGNDSHS
jgi:hypothetical protein